jgi:hypothetical protein
MFGGIPCKKLCQSVVEHHCASRHVYTEAEEKRLERSSPPSRTKSTKTQIAGPGPCARTSPNVSCPCYSSAWEYAIQKRLFLILVLAVLTATLPTLDKCHRSLLNSLDALLIAMVLLERQPLLEYRLAFLCGAHEKL